MAKPEPSSPTGPAALPADPCPICGTSLDLLRVCPQCGHHAHLLAWQRIDQLSDRGTFQETAKHLWSGNPIQFSDGLSSYEKQVAAAQAETQLLDAVITGRARLLSTPVVLVVFDFRFMGGSMGSVVGEKIVRAFDMARRERLTAIVVCSSGGARIQEGMVALFQMAKTSLVAARLREDGVPLLTVLSDPTMGGVLASFAGLGDVILAEPRARVSFVGPRVHEKAIHDPAPPGSAEFALQHGTIDAIVERAGLRPVLGQLAALLGSRVARPARTAHADEPFHQPEVQRPVWETVELARNSARPSGRYLARLLFTDLVELHGDRTGGDDPSVVAGVGRLGDRPVVVVAQDRHSAGGGRTTPGGYRKAQRAFSIAERFKLPLLTFVDTPGAATNAEAESGGITGAVAESLARLGRLRTTVINVVVGEGGSGGALALSVGDRLLMLENAIFSVIGPEAASAILYHDSEHAHELAGRLKLTASDLVALRIVDRIVPEQPAGHEAPEMLATVLRRVLLEELAGLGQTSINNLLKRREAKFRQVHSLRGRLRLLIRPQPGSAGDSRRAKA